MARTRRVRRRAPVAMETRPVPKATGQPVRLTLLAAGLIVVAAVLAYANSFAGVLIFDDIEAIAKNPHIESIFPLSRSMSAPENTTLSGRPLVSLSLAMNYAISERRLWSYHAFNLGVHILAGLTLFGLIRRTLVSERLANTFRQSAHWLALVCTLIWLVHPLCTQAVTYVVQRAESMAALLGLVTLYCTAAAHRSAREGLWQIGAVLACAAAMATKETAAVIPILVLIYDLVFLSRSPAELARRRWAFYAGLAGTWLILAAIVLGGPRQATAGFTLTKFTPLTYAATQCGVILHYLRLSFRPWGLVLDYGWPAVDSLSDFALQGTGVLVLLVATAVALIRRPAVGFLGVWFFLLLAPTSSFVPIADAVFEHRMYLPLAGPVSATVIAAFVLGRRLGAAHPQASKAIAALVVVAMVSVLGVATQMRNRDYTSQVRMWTDATEKRPGNRRGYLELGLAYLKDGKAREAILSCTQSLRIDPRYGRAYLHRAIAYGQSGEYDKAIADFDAAIRIDPNYYHAYVNRAKAYMLKRQWDMAVADYRKALKLRPGDRIAAAGLQEANRAGKTKTSKGSLLDGIDD